ncbi:MAG: glycosyltransferase family 2 protein [Phycisphaeraceae bacterium]|nr:glycosyltransferase family 2 protein [Phycisphaeraceae bacterium]
MFVKPSTSPTRVLDLSVVTPAHNEQDNLEALAKEIEKALSPLSISWELVVVDDGSTDRTRTILTSLAADRPWLRVVAMSKTPPGKGNGQSAAFHAGIRAARGRLIATMDSDLQNDPADLPMMLRRMAESGADLVQGDRSHARQDNVIRKIGSWVGRTFRRLLLGDRVRDTGCSLRIMKREFALALPLELRGMHRFVPVTIRDLGGKIVEVQVNHRPRHAGETKYGLGITKRAIPGLIDLFAVRYFRSRRRSVESVEIAPENAASRGSTPGAATNQPAEMHA